jgi:cytochrome b561
LRQERYNTVAIILHWVIALGILVQIVMGLAMTHLAIPIGLKFTLYQLHKSIGITVLLAILLRAVWRFTYTPPALPETMPALERRAAWATHFVLYVFMLALPFTGWALVSASPYNIPTVLYGVVPLPDLPVFSTLANKQAASNIMTFIHSRLAFILIALLALHIAAALRHHFLLRDGVLHRMIPFLPRR